MDFHANAFRKLSYYFDNMKWYSNSNQPSTPITEEIVQQLFRQIGINELSTITLFRFEEVTQAVINFQDSFTYIKLEVFAIEYNDFVRFSYYYSSDPVKGTEHEEREINFDNLKTFQKFCYDFDTGKWEISNT